MVKSIFLFFLVFACTTSPVKKELAYKGEPLSDIGHYGVLVGHTLVPIDKFPYDRRSAVIYFENLKTKEEFFYGETLGSFFLKLPPGDYGVKDIWSGGKCNSTTGLMISDFFIKLPGSVAHLRRHIETPATATLTFRIAQGKMTDIGNLLMTCFEWDATPKFLFEFSDFIQDGKFQVFRPMSQEADECGCKILRKKDGKSLKEMKKILKMN
jgi:hypothetical protein